MCGPNSHPCLSPLHSSPPRSSSLEKPKLQQSAAAATRERPSGDDGSRQLLPQLEWRLGDEAMAGSVGEMIWIKICLDAG
uniref:Uncharacterized protein n=1 Tax=Oryza rufipogon TaxID=4529 RepID=A0A0E0RAM4_ORYRU